MNKRVITYIRQHSGQTIEPELQQAVEHQGDMVIASYMDDGSLTGRGKFSGWRRLLANLNGIDQVIMGCAADIPGKTVADLCKILTTFHDHGISLRLHRERIDTGDGAPAVLDLIAGYRAAKLSEAIKVGQQKAVAAGKRIGRPEVAPIIQSGIRAALADGGGVRPTARRFKVSPAYVVNVRRTMVGTDMMAT
jgi:DNA invertase Pin-like site-specific DNA recombinase